MCKEPSTPRNKKKEEIMKEEPAYQRFEGECRKCGKEVIYYNSVK